MGKSLHDQVKANVLRMENERLKQEEEKAKAEKAHTKEVIMSDLDSTLKVCLESLRDYTGQEFQSGDAAVLDFFEEAVCELGFVVSHQEYPSSYHLSIPAFEKGTRRTLPQLKLSHFQQELAKARKERKAEVLIDCKKVKGLIREGKYTYNTDVKTSYISIVVETEKRLDTFFEREVVKSFFSKFNLKFVGTGPMTSVWVFTL